MDFQRQIIASLTSTDTHERKRSKLFKIKQEDTCDLRAGGPQAVMSQDLQLMFFCKNYLDFVFVHTL